MVSTAPMLIGDPPRVEGYLRGEAPLSELLHDPIARALMIADKVDSSVVCELLRAVRRAS